MARPRETFPVEFKGGLVTNLSPLQQGVNMPGSATVLKNFEPSIVGGYRRILGFTKFDSNKIPPYGSLVVNGAGQSSNSLEVSGAHTPIAQGDTITIAGVSGTYTITGVSHNAANNTDSLTLGTSLDSSPANAAAVTVTSYSASHRTQGVEVFGNDVIVALNADIYKTSGSGFTKINVPTYGTVLVNGGSQTGGTLAVDGLTVAPQSGDIFTIAGVDKVYTVTSDAGGVGGQTLAISPNLASSPADNAAITFISLNREGGDRTRFVEYDFDGTPKLAMVDGFNPPALYNGTTFIELTGVSNIEGANHVTEFKNHLFFSKSNLVQHTKIGTDNDFTDSGSAGDAGSFRVAGTVTGMLPFRDALIIFTDRSIQQLTGDNTSSSPFILKPISTDIGCIDGDTIKEIGGDVMFFTSDGLRLLSATDRIGDFGLGIVSKPIQSVMIDFVKSATLFTSLIIREKSQYRLFAFNPNVIASASKGIIATQYAPQGATDFQFSEIRGMKVFAASSKMVGSEEVVIFSGDNGLIYKMESGNSFDGSNIETEFKSPFVPLNDPRVRKSIHKVNLYTDPQGSVNFTFDLKFDFEEVNSVQPESIVFTNNLLQIAFYGVNTFAKYAVLGSGSSGSTTITVDANTNMEVGDTILAVGGAIPTDTTITNIDGTTITISDALTDTISNVRITNSAGVFGGELQTLYNTQTVGTGFTAAIRFRSNSTDPPFSLDAATFEYITNTRR